MFPINFNFPYRKKDGSVITMEKALDGAGADLDLIDLDDVAITTPAEGDTLVYDNTAKKWKNSDVVTDIVEKATNRGLHIPSTADSFAGAVSSMFTAVIPLLSNVGDIADGCLEALSYDYFDFTVVKISSTIYRALINQGTRLVTSIYNNGEITSYKYDGTELV